MPIFPDFSLIGKGLLKFPGFPDLVETLKRGDLPWTPPQHVTPAMFTEPTEETDHNTSRKMDK